MTRCLLLGLFGFAIVGCESKPNPLYPIEVAPPAILAASNFNSETAGRIEGTVVWEGPKPDEADYRCMAIYPGEQGLREPLRNPHIPRFGANNGMGDVVVFLRGIDPGKSKPWDQPPAKVEIRSGNLHVVQGESTDSRAGFVPLGGTVEMISHEPTLQSIRGREADFFTLMFADPGQKRQRTLSKPGKIELSNGSMQFWMRAWLFVCEHSYYTRTNNFGAFVFEDVPEGKYDVVAWVPNWNLDRAERDPELLGFARIWYMPAVEKIASIEVKRGKTASLKLPVTLQAFQKHPDNRLPQ